MNKKLMALAIAAALAPAAAMADSGNVTIYGVMDASVDIIETGDGRDNRTVTGVPNGPSIKGARASKISSNNSRLGFKGNEDLGNGLSAVWQLESTIGADGTAYALSTRNTFVGLSSKTAGTVTLGRQDSPYKISTRAYDYFTDGLADNRNLMGGGTTGTGSATSFDNRWADSVLYTSPSMSGFRAAAAYAAVAENESLDTQSRGRAWSLAGMYDNGPLSASLAYERHSYGNAATATNPTTAGVNHPGFNVTAASGFAGKSEKSWKLGVGYTFGPLMVSGVIEKTNDDFDPIAVGAVDPSLAHKAYTLGAKYKMGSNDLKLAYTKANDLDGTANSGAKQWALGVDHHMSKRTKVYAQYVKLSNDTNAEYGLTGANASGNVFATGYDADPSAWSFGMRHSF